MLKKYSILITVVLLAVMGSFFWNGSNDQQLADKKSFKNTRFIPESIGEKESEERDNPQLAAAQNFEMTKDHALGYPPTERKLQAYTRIEEFQKSREGLRSAIPGVQWIERGPNNVGGRTRALMFDPNDASSKKVWAGSVGGGLWYNTDITSPVHKWQQPSGIMTNLIVSSIAYDPSNTQTFYLGTGLGHEGTRGEGIWKSTDGGNTWEHISSTTSFTFVQKILVNSEGIIFATTTDGIQRSIDGGATWATSLPGSRASDIEIASNGNMFATTGVGSTGDIFRSIDKGLSWTNISPSGLVRRIELAIAPTNPDVIYAVSDSGGGGFADVGYFKKSIDGGNTWEDITVPLYIDHTSSDCTVGPNPFTRGQAFFNLILKVHPENEDIVLAGGIDVHRTTDGGSTWEPVSYWTGSGCDDYVHADQHEIVFRPNHPNEAIFGNDGGVFHSVDIGDAPDPTFNSRNAGYVTALQYSVAMVNEVNSNLMFTGLQDNGTLEFSNPGLSSTREAFGGDGTFTFVDQDEPTLVIASTPNVSYRLSSDGGQTFPVVLIQDNTRGQFINPADYDSEANILYAAGNTDELIRVNDVGGTPSSDILTVALDGGQISAITVSPYTSNTIFVGVAGSPGRIYKIENAESATPAVSNISGSADGFRGQYVSSIAIGDSEDQLMNTYSNFGISSVYETTDGGINWVDKDDNLPDIPIRWGLYNPNNRNQVLLATELGIWSSNAFNSTSPNWEPTNSGLASVRVNMLQYRTADEVVAAATFGRGLFTSKIFATTIDADFKTDQIVSYVGIPVDFEDASLLPNDSWSWDFGDGGTSTLQNPKHTYTVAGTYDVSLSIDNGSSSETKTGYITILPVKSAPYTLAEGGDFESNPNDFASRAIMGGLNVWERGTPGNRLTTTSSGVNAWKTGLDTDLGNPGFAYASALYTPAFDLSDTEKDYSLSFQKSIEGSFCNAPFGMLMEYSLDGGKSWSRLGTTVPTFGATNWYNQGDIVGCAFNTDLFTDGEGWNAVVTDDIDLSIDNELTEHKLNFLAGESNVSFRFVAKSITGFSAYERDGFMIDDFQVIADDPQAEFDTDSPISYVDFEHQFNYQSNGATSFLWDFGDGETSTGKNPKHSYTSGGSYDVSLAIVSSQGTVTETKAQYITILPERDIPYELSDGGDFESNQSDFAARNVTGTPFELGSSSITGKDGTASGSNAWVTDLDAALYLNDSEASLLTPSFSMLAVGDYTLSFKANFAFEPTWDGFIVQFTTDRGKTWNKLNNNQEAGWYNQTSNEQSIFGAIVPIFSGTTDGSFEAFSTNVSFLAPNESVAFRFLFRTDANTLDAGLAIDDFALDGPEAGPAAAEFSFTGNTGCSGQEVVFTNESTGSISSLEWDFGANATPATASGIGPHTVIYSGDGNSTVTLTATSPVNGTVVETKTGLINTAPSFSPSFIEEPGSQDFTALLTATQGDSYQWFLEGVAIDGATDQSYATDTKGNYSVAVTIGTCTILTSTINVITATEEDTIFSESVSIYPNPTKGITNVKISDPVTGKITLNIFDATGTTLLSKEVDKNNFEEIYQVDLAGLGQGVYLLEIKTGVARTVKRIFRE